MSTLIQLALPIKNFDCLKDALSQLGYKFQISGEDFILSNGISLRRTNVGYIAEISEDRSLKNHIMAIRKEYSKIQEEKLFNLQKKIANIQSLSPEERQKVLIENQKNEVQNKQVVSEMAKMIEHRANELGYMVQYMKDEKNNTKMILVKRQY